MEPVKEFLFEYKIDGRTYCVTMPGRDMFQAYERLEWMQGLAQYKGEFIAKIPAGPIGWLHKWWLGK